MTLVRLLLALLIAATVGGPIARAQGDTAPPSEITRLGDAGVNKLRGGDADGAIADLNKAVSATRRLLDGEPQNATYTYWLHDYSAVLARAHAAKGEFDRAIQLMQPSARWFKQHAATTADRDVRSTAAAAFGDLAGYQLLTGRPGEAVENARQAVEFDPDDAQARANLAHALVLHGKTAEAEQIYLAYRDQRAGDGTPYRELFLRDFDTLERAGFANGRFARMRQLLGAQSAGATAERPLQRRAERDRSGIGCFPIVAVLMLIGGAIVSWLARSRQAKQTQSLQAAAASLGFRYRPSGTPLERQTILNSPLQRLGSSGEVQNVIEVPEQQGAGCWLFEFTYYTSSGGGRGMRMRSRSTQPVALVRSSKLQLPEFEMHPEGWASHFSEAVGYKDIDFPEAPEFSRTYFLHAKDDVAVRRAFTPEVIRYFAQHPGWTVFAKDDMLLLYRAGGELRPENIASAVAAALEAAAPFSHRSDSSSAQPPPLPQ